MKKGDKARWIIRIWSLIAILMIVTSVFGGAVSAENVSDDLTKSVADAEIQTAVTDDVVNIEFADESAPLGVVKSTGVNKPSVVSRTGWGCPDGQSSPGWPPQYHTVTHIIIHHTATPNTDPDWPARVRQIWDYHTNTKGWGDIGYNYLIDPNGVIYEGRAGGDDVIAGHAYGHNVGTMGVALLGTFSSVEPTSAALRSAESLLAWKCDQRNIDPLGSGTDYAGTYYNYIAGHRDVSSTECPGDKLYNLLPTIRQNVFDLISGQPDLIVEDIWTEPAEFQPGDTVKLWQRTKNIGDGDAVGTFRIQRYFDGTPISYANKNGLAAGASYTSYCTYTWPSDCNLHTVKVVADLYDAITESNEDNNERSESFSAVCEDIDLTVTSVNAPSSAEVGGYIAVSWTVKNQGNAPSGSFYNRISLATTPYGTDISLGNFYMGSIAAGSSSSDAEVPKIPGTVSPGYYYVTVFADAFDDVTESNENNNINKAPNQIHITEPPEIELTPSSHSFGNIEVGSCSSEYSFTLTNTGGGTATGSVSLTGTHASQFTITQGSGSFSLGAGASKTLKVKFCPDSTGAKSATLYADGSNCNDDTSSLSGTGTQAPSIGLSPSSHSFGNVDMGQCSSEYSFTLTNTGGGTATGSVSLTGTHASQFTITQGSGSFSLGAGASKTIKVKFCPASTGSKSATLYADGSNCNDDTSSLSGTGTQAPSIDLSPPSHLFGNVEVGSCSSEYSFTLTNTGGGTATGSVSLTGTHASQFSITQGSGSFSLGAGSSKTIKVKFCPTSTGSKSATLKADGTNCNDDTSSLSGTGTQAQRTITFYTDPTDGGTITFDGSTYHNGQSTTETDGTYSVSANPASNYEFDHWSTNGGVSVANSYSQSTTVTVSGDGSIKAWFNYIPPPEIELTPPNQDFGSVKVDECSSEYSFTLTNTGGGTATGSVSRTGTHASQFTITQGSGSFSLGAVASKTIKVKFCPTSTGSKSATLYAEGSNCNDDSSSLSGTGTPPQRTITFYTYLTDGGTITFDGSTYSNGQSTTETDGTYSVSANPASNYVFDHWTTTGGVSVANSYSQSTTATVSGDGSIKAWFNYVPPQRTITFYADPTDGGTITFDGSTFSNGQSTTKPDGLYSVSATPASNYEFDHWTTTGAVSVSNPNSQSTTAIVSGDGSIKAWFNYIPPEDTTPPSAVTDLATTDPTSNSIKLTWTAPGDDGNIGTATTYDIRYLEGTPITESNWASATQCTDEPSPNPAGSAEAFVVTGLSPDTTYYFALKTADEVPNWSPISNSPTGTTKGAAITATREISPQQVRNGSTLTVTVTIIANQYLYAPILDEDPPTGWSVTPVQNDGATFKESEIKWLWTESLSKGDSRTVIYNVTVPSDTTPEDYMITGNVSAYGVKPITVGGDNTITVITDWNPWDDDGIITDSEIQEAVYCWLTDTPKNDHLITDSEIQELVYMWLTG